MKRFKRLACWFILLLSLAGNTGFAAPTKHPKPILNEQREIFIEAEKALKSNNHRKFKKLYQSLDGYPLQAYLERDRLIKALSDHSITDSARNQIKQFLVKQNRNVVARKLRYHWLNYLANTHQTDIFLEFYHASSSVKLKCQHLQFRLERKGNINDIYPQIESIWLTHNSIPNKCDDLLKQWKKSGQLTDNLIWQRMMLAAGKKKYSLVTYLNNKRSPSNKATGELLLKVLKKPERLLSIEFKQNISRQGQNIILKGLNKLAWQDPFKAIKAWKKFDYRLQLTPEQTETLKRSIGLSLAIDQEPEAKNWLMTLNNERDKSVDHWLLSSALNSQDWSLIESVTEQKNKQSIDIDKWRYWQAISSKNNGFSETSDWMLKSLAGNRSYYGFLAAISQQQQPDLNNAPKIIEDKILNQLANKESAKSAFEFYQMNRIHDARREWNNLVKHTNSDELVALAHLAHQWGWDHQSILAFAKSKQIDDIERRFPFYKIDLYRSESNKHQIPTSWAYAITRQESAFKQDAYSGAGAQGLMQLKPSTARLVARRQFKTNPIKYKNNTQLRQPTINVKLGIAHLKEMLDYYKGNPVLATAAYNAGKHRVNQWLKDNVVSDSILWIEQIPYKETREYVKNVLTYQQIYSQLDNSPNSFIASLSDYLVPTNIKVGSNVATQ